MAPQAQIDPAALPARWRELEAAVEDLAALVRQGLPSAEFYALLLQRAAREMAAAGGAAWLLDGRRRLQLVQSAVLDATLDSNAAVVRLTRDELLRRVCDEGQVEQAHVASPPTSPDGNSSVRELRLWTGPIKGGNEIVGAIEFWGWAGDPQAQGPIQEFVAAMCELAGEQYRSGELALLRARDAAWARLAEFIEQVHAPLDLHQAAFALANRGRQVIACGRLSVLIRRGSAWRLIAVSGLDHIERKAPLARRIEALVAAVARQGEPLRYARGEAHLAPQVTEPLQAYLDESQARRLECHLLSSPEAAWAPRPTAARAMQPTGALVFEWYHESPGGAALCQAPFADCAPHDAAFDDTTLDQRLQAVCRHGAIALERAAAWASLPLLPLERFLQAAGRLLQLNRLPATAMALLIAVALGLALVFIPADFQVEARGELQPVVRRELFAPADGIVTRLHGGEDRKVRAAHDVLVALRNPQLDQEQVRIEGEIETASKRLAAIQAVRLQNPGEDRDGGGARAAALTAEEEELKAALAGWQQQLQALLAQQQTLLVRSPIDGFVVTWDVVRRLEGRPVRRGESLLAVADTDGPWIAELYVPDDRIGFVLDAQKDRGRPLDVSFRLATDPQTAYNGQVIDVADSVQTHETIGPAVLVKVRVDRQVSRRRPGATVLARIDCGQRALGYVWFHDLVDAARTWFWW